MPSKIELQARIDELVKFMADYQETYLRMETIIATLRMRNGVLADLLANNMDRLDDEDGVIEGLLNQSLQYPSIFNTTLGLVKRCIADVEELPEEVAFYAINIRDQVPQLIEKINASKERGRLLAASRSDNSTSVGSVVMQPPDPED